MTTKKKTIKKTKSNCSWKINSSEAIALLKQHLPEAVETVQTMCRNKQVKKSQLQPLHGRLAYRIALLGLCKVDTLAKEVTERTYSATPKTSERSLKATLKNATEK